MSIPSKNILKMSIVTDSESLSSGVSSEHAQSIQQFRANLSDVLLTDHDDHYFLKWLKARKYNLKAAEKMLRDHLAFREKWKVDYLASEWEPPEVLRLYMSGGEYGHDVDGRPVFYQGLGTLDTHGILHSASRQDILKYTILICENIQKAITKQRTKLGRLIENITLIVDMENVGFQIIWRPFFTVYSEMLKIFEANYPENLHVCFVINAPPVFTTAYSLVKPFLSDDTQNKITVLGHSYRHVLLDRIAADQLPVYYGGSATSADGSPKCNICFGGKVPMSYYLNNEVLREKFTDISISRGSSIRLTYDILTQGTILSWEFMTGKDDIEFSVRYKDAQVESLGSKMSNPDTCATSSVVNKRRICSPRIPENGTIICHQPGQYVIEFNNSYSWFRSKKVSYFVEVLEPEQT